MDDSTAIIMFVAIAMIGVIALIVKATESSNKQEVEGSAVNKIRTRGIQQSIIKQSAARIYHDKWSTPQGVLVLTWDMLFFFGTEKDIEIPVPSIRSTSSERVSGGTNAVILADSGTFRFYWYDDQKTVPGIAATGGGFATGMGISKTGNPNVQEWMQLIDDLRFGKLKKPS